MGLRADSARPQRVSSSARTDSRRAESARNPIASHVNFGDDSALSAFTRTQWTAAFTPVALARLVCSLNRRGRALPGWQTTAVGGGGGGWVLHACGCVLRAAVSCVRVRGTCRVVSPGRRDPVRLGTVRPPMNGWPVRAMSDAAGHSLCQQSCISASSAGDCDLVFMISLPPRGGAPGRVVSYPSVAARHCSLLA